MGDQLESILDKAYKNYPLTKEDIILILNLRNEDYINALFKTARELRSRYFHDKIFIYGFLYISTYCRNDCNFCFYRVSNPKSLRYRKEEAQIVEAAVALAQSGVHLIDITLGEDPEFFNKSRGVGGPAQKGIGFETLFRIVERVKETTSLPLMVSPGLVPEHVLESLVAAGASWFACYQETHQRTLFEQLRPSQSYYARFNIKRLAHKYGLLIEEGILVGVGETPGDIALSIDAVTFLDPDQMRAMNFIPQKGTPMENLLPPDPLRELLIIALIRLMFPDKLIPATLDVEGLPGLKQRLEAGANVVTSIVPPNRGLAGVAQSYLDIDDARRTTSSVLPVLENCGLRPAAPGEYFEWIRKRKKSIKPEIRNTKFETNTNDKNTKFKTKTNE